ncbi:response regulator [Halococcoides cellulosivorans]|uniref:Response regulator n=1 Tax=Halococcoides cellulosivorans TaxID=1679096 RepID=A0A2R4WZZ7_9EURY|nr:response regulator [Halococcoides cellulosivorans]AWB27122.1 response regulator [Halococcoides cellulosivorans]
MSEAISVLLVDEDTDVLELAETFLEQSDDLSVTAVTSTSAALDHFETEPVDCVVSDYTMPEMTGTDLLEAIRDRDASMPFFLFTGRDARDIRQELDDESPTGYVRKGEGPDQYTQLADDIRDAVTN